MRKIFKKLLIINLFCTKNDQNRLCHHIRDFHTLNYIHYSSYNKTRLDQYIEPLSKNTKVAMCSFTCTVLIHKKLPIFYKTVPLLFQTYDCAMVVQWL